MSLEWSHNVKFLSALSGTLWINEDSKICRVEESGEESNSFRKIEPSSSSAPRGKKCHVINLQVISATMSSTTDDQIPPKKHKPSPNDGDVCAKLDKDSRMVLLTRNGGSGMSTIGQYPYVWLRDNCQCSDCFHPSSRGRLVLMSNLNPDIIPSSIEITFPDQVLQVRWSDGHISPFPVSWLAENQFSNMTVDPVSKPPRHFWGHEMETKIPTFLFSSLLKSDKALHDWIEALQIYGLALVKDTPQEEGALPEIGKRVSFLKTTNYGETFQVFSKFEASNLAYTNAELGLHTDLPFYSYPPNIQMLHCIKQAKAKGGENQFCDGYKVAENLRHINPAAYHILTNTPVDFRNWGKDYTDYHMKYSTPIIELSSDGRYKAISYNDQVRAPYFHIPVEDIEKVYRAIKTFNTDMYKKEHLIEIKLKEGEIICFDNQRVLHGRSAFTLTESSTRHYEGAYIDWDAACSRMRVIRDQMLDLQPL